MNESFPSALPASELIPPGACNLLNSSTIYANNEVSLAEVDIYGFDYDYTLALYSNALNTMIYNTARGFLIEHFKVCVSFFKCIFFTTLGSDELIHFVPLINSTLKASTNMITFPTLLLGAFTMTSKR